jgi:hypothetical protein
MWETWMITFILGWLALGVHRAFFASMSKLPGPWYTRFTDFYLMYREFTAQRRAYIHDLHQKFGPVIRIGPNEASFTSVEALSEIYQSQGTGYDKSTFYNNFMQYGQR